MPASTQMYCNVPYSSTAIPPTMTRSYLHLNLYLAGRHTHPGCYKPHQTWNDTLAAREEALLGTWRQLRDGTVGRNRYSHRGLPVRPARRAYWWLRQDHFTTANSWRNMSLYKCSRTAQLYYSACEFVRSHAHLLVRADSVAIAVLTPNTAPLFSDVIVLF